LPELYAGLHREAANFPVQYRGANVPQAWAAGSVFSLLHAMLATGCGFFETVEFVCKPHRDWIF
jgi:glycogen debranching enzyme